MTACLNTWGNPERRFALLVSILIGLFMLFYHQDWMGALLGPWVDLTARMTLAVLQVLGLEAVRLGSQIHHSSGFAYEIYYRCTGILPAAVLSILVIATRAPWRAKGLALTGGIPLLIMFNLVRLVHLFYLGIHQPILFDQAHYFLWEPLLIVATLGLWLGWDRWVRRLECKSRERGLLFECLR